MKWKVGQLALLEVASIKSPPIFRGRLFKRLLQVLASHRGLMRIVILTVVNEQGHHGRYQLPGISEIISQNEMILPKEFVRISFKIIGGAQSDPKSKPIMRFSKEYEQN